MRIKTVGDLIAELQKHPAAARVVHDGYGEPEVYPEWRIEVTVRRTAPASTRWDRVLTHDPINRARAAVGLGPTEPVWRARETAVPALDETRTFETDDDFLTPEAARASAEAWRTTSVDPDHVNRRDVTTTLVSVGEPYLVVSIGGA